MKINIKKRIGFTLAEVLIALAIIGIVAAVTIPILVKNYREKATVIKVKKMYSMLSNAVKLATVDNGDIEQWDWSSTGAVYSKQTASNFWQYLKPYMKTAKECGDNKNCYYNGYVKSLNGDNWANYNTMNRYFKLILADGSTLWLRTGATNSNCNNADGGVYNFCAGIWYDVDGKKGDNTLGKDVFFYVVTPNGVLPSQDSDCSKTSTGFSCSKYIIEHGNMDYLK